MSLATSIRTQLGFIRDALQVIETHLQYDPEARGSAGKPLTETMPPEPDAEFRDELGRQLDEIRDSIARHEQHVNSSHVHVGEDLAARVANLERIALQPPASQGEPDRMTAARLDAHDRTINHAMECVTDFETRVSTLIADMTHLLHVNRREVQEGGDTKALVESARLVNLEKRMAEALHHIADLEKLCARNHPPTTDEDTH